MNQILVTKKLYITPELKRKKKIYKFDFILSIFLVCILTSFYIYAEYDRNKSEETSQQILADINRTVEENNIEDKTVAKQDILLVVLDDAKEDEEADLTVAQNQSPVVDKTTSTKQNVEKRTTKNGYTYSTVATVKIPKLNIEYPVLQGETWSSDEMEALLKISPTKYWGGDPNEVGNFCIVGHNYRNSKFFSKVPTLAIGDKILLTDLSGRTLTYEIYNKYTVDPSDTSCTSQLTGGKKEVTLITCTDDSKLRVIVKGREVR